MIENNTPLCNSQIKPNEKLNNIVALNVGYGKVKVKYEDNIFQFDSRISNHVDESFSQTVLVNGTRYVVGIGHYNLELDKTTTLHQRILIEYALSKVPYTKKRIIAAMPINCYINKTARSEYYSFIKSFNNVEDVIVYPEGASLVMYDYPYFAKRLVLLMDIGHYTINFMLLDNGDLIKDSAFNRPLGNYVLMNRIRKALEQKALCNIPDYQLKYMLDDETVRKVVTNYIEEIRIELSRMQYPTDVTTRITGGGCLTFKEMLQQSFSAYIGENPIYENVIGLYNIAKGVWKI